ncbi:MAG: hypothetical protein ACREDY_13285 [Bradyrhizobium sp.]
MPRKDSAGPRRCGTLDKVNITAARFIATELPHATLRIESDAGQLWNVHDAVRFNAMLGEILDQD